MVETVARMRLRRGVASAVALCVGLGVMMHPAAVRPVAAQQAEESFEAVIARASSKYEAKDYAGAIEDFKRAYEIKQVPNLLYNIARTYEKMGKFEEALSYYERFVNEPEVSVEARTDALARLKALREVVAMRKAEADAKLKAEADAKRQAEEQQRLAEEEARRKKALEPPPEPDRTISYVFLGAGGLALIGSGVFALMASGAHGDFEEATTLDDRRSAADSGQTYSLLADSLLGAGVVLAAVGVVFFVIAEPEQGDQPATTLRLMPEVGADGAAVRLRLDF